MRRISKWLTLAGALGVLVVGALPAAAGTASFTDPDDVPTPLDIELSSHTNDASNITYEMDTYEAFSNDEAVFAWALDTNCDEEPDVLIVAGGDGEGGLVLVIADEESFRVFDSGVSRPAGDRLRVTFSRSEIGDPPAYQYAAASAFDLNGDGDAEDPGEIDFAANDQVVVHDLSTDSDGTSPTTGTSGTTGTSETTGTSGGAEASGCTGGPIFPAVTEEVEDAPMIVQTSADAETQAAADEQLPVSGSSVPTVVGIVGGTALVLGFGLMIASERIYARLPIYWETFSGARPGRPAPPMTETGATRTTRRRVWERRER